MNRATLRKTIAWIGITGATLWIAGILYVLVGGIWEKSGWAGRIFTVLFLGILSIPAASVISAGGRLRRGYDEGALRIVIGVFSFALAFVITSAISPGSRVGVADEDLNTSIDLVVVVVLFVALYLQTMKTINGGLTGETRSRLYFVGKGVIGFTAFALFIILSRGFDRILKDLEHRNEAWADLVALLPFVLAWCCYAFGCRIFRVEESREDSGEVT